MLSVEEQGILDLVKGKRNSCGYENLRICGSMKIKMEKEDTITILLFIK